MVYLLGHEGCPSGGDDTQSVQPDYLYRIPGTETTQKTIMIPGWNFPPTVVGNESLRGIFSLRLSATKSLAGFPACNRREQNPGREFIACGCRLVFPCGDDLPTAAGCFFL